MIGVRRERLDPRRPLVAEALLALARLAAQRGELRAGAEAAEDALGILRGRLGAERWRSSEAQELLRQLRASL